MGRLPVPWEWLLVVLATRPLGKARTDLAFHDRSFFKFISGARKSDSGFRFQPCKKLKFEIQFENLKAQELAKK